jgi:hypothetical protein
MDINDHLILIGGTSATGKSTSLMYLDNPEGVMYLNCENGKRLPFKSKFKEYTITDPMDIYDAFTSAEENTNIHTIVIDSLTYMMSMYQAVYVDTSSNGLKAWGEFSNFFKRLMQQYVAKSSKNVIFTAHTTTQVNESEMVQEVVVKVPGSLMNVGIESFFSTVIATKKVPLKILKNYQNDLLHITEEDEALGFKNCFQTRLTKETVNERIRGPLGMWKPQETFIDNNTQTVMNRLKDYYE